MKDINEINKDINEIKRQLNKDFEGISDWFIHNKLSIYSL